ncbi:S8 family peptidase [Streptomyces venezuelae]|uniref:S8 family peptidase n=1 Tax=Streptomyces venezuelae TaxID=54571 RepID=UPI003320AFAA
MTAFAALLPAAALLAAATTAATTAASAVVGPVPGAPRPDTAPYVVVLKDTASRIPAHTLAAEAADAGDEVGAVYDAALNGFAVRTTAARAAALATDPRVASVEPDTEFHTTDTPDTPSTPAAGATATPDTPGTPGTGTPAPATPATPAPQSGPQAPAPWSLDRIDQRELPLDGSYTYPGRAAGVTVYVVDTGINTGHREFGGRARLGYNAVFLGSSRDCSGHGTHVAATVGGETYGVAKGVSLVGVKVADCRGSAPLSAILKGLDWVVRDAARAPATPAVANMSIGGSRSRALDAAVVRAVASGITFVAAAGNDGKNACGGSPAAVPQAITVGATDDQDRRARFSNHGPCVDLSAPGVGITSAWKDSPTATARSSGTSMAAPHVAGVAALVLARGTARTPAQVTRELLHSAVSDRITGLPAGTPNLLLHTPTGR